MQHSISAAQFEKARSLCKQIRATIELRQKMIRRGTLDPDLFSPSRLWAFIERMSYCLDPPYEIVNTWRLHTWVFTGHPPLHNALYFASAASGSADRRVGGEVPRDLETRYRQATAGLPENLMATPARLFAENGWEIERKLVNEDVLMYQQHVANLYDLGVIGFLRARGHVNILEIGGGYGGLASFLKRAIPGSTYYLVDLPESLVFQAVYLGIALDDCVDAGSVCLDEGQVASVNSADKRFHFVSDFLADAMPADLQFDLVINTGSFGEMTAAQVERYVSIIKRSLRGVLYEHNQDAFVPVSQILSRHLTCLSSAAGPRIWARTVISLPKPSSRAAMERRRSATVRLRRECARALRKLAGLVDGRG